jgi:hypothetical protein
LINQPHINKNKHSAELFSDAAIENLKNNEGIISYLRESKLFWLSSIINSFNFN